MRPHVLLVAAVLGGLLLGGARERRASAQPAAVPTPSSSAIECALDPKCAKPQSRPRSMRRGVAVESGQAERPLSVDLYVNFAYNSAELTSDARITLDQLGAALRDPRLAEFNFVIAGHTDAKGGSEFNQKLSERRAEAVRSYLVAQFGIASERLAAKGYGKTQLLDPQHPEDGVNRRVQVINAGAAGQSRD
jgi:outer membrane protein OmpA-like peptidoglycan-associated protein